MKLKTKRSFRKNLFFKWFFTCLSIILIITTLLGVIMSFVLANYYKKDQYQYLSSHIDNAISFTFKKVQNSTNENIRFEISEIYRLLSKSMNEVILLFDTNGTLLCSQYPNEEVKFNNTEIPNLILQDLETNGVYYGTRRFSSSDALWYTVGKHLTLQNQTQDSFALQRTQKEA